MLLLNVVFKNEAELDDIIGKIINDLNDYAQNNDSYDYGLPVYGEHIVNMKKIIKERILLKNF
jgi:uncharacterized protein (UPF0332 family)